MSTWLCVCSLRSFKKVIIILKPPQPPALIGDHCLGDTAIIREGFFLAPDMGNKQSWWHHQVSEDLWQGLINTTGTFACHPLWRHRWTDVQSQQTREAFIHSLCPEDDHPLTLPSHAVLTCSLRRSSRHHFWHLGMLAWFILRSTFIKVDLHPYLSCLVFLCFQSPTLLFFLIFFTPCLYFCT